MGEIADMMLDGTMDPETGEFNFDGADGPGWPMTGVEAAEYRRASVSTDAECLEYLADLHPQDDPVECLRLFMGVGKKRARRLAARHRAIAAPVQQGASDASTGTTQKDFLK